MDCHHGHHHHHHHHHSDLAEGLSSVYLTRLKVVFTLSVLYLAFQVIGGYMSGSLGLLAEAGHKFGDLAIVGLALIAAWVAKVGSSPQKTFGYDRVEVIAAFLSGISLIFAAFFIVAEAQHRLGGHHHDIQGNLMLTFALIGLTLNVTEVWILNPVKESNLNIRGAYYHILADLMGSLGNVVSAILILRYQIHWLDTALSFLIAAFVLYNGIVLIKDAVSVLLNMSPKQIKLDELTDSLCKQPGVKSIHDLHVWRITTGKDALMAHVVVDDDAFTPEKTLELEHFLREAYNICHLTLQLEPLDFPKEEIPF